MSRKFSFSQLNTFETCNYKWFDQYCLYNKQKTTKAMEDGNRIHKEFEDTFSGVIPMTDRVMVYKEAVENLAGQGSIHTELELAINQQGEICSYRDHNRLFVGKADLVVLPKVNPDGTYASRIAYYIDWKTGKSGYEKPFQLDLMAMLINKFSRGQIDIIATRLAYIKTHMFYPDTEWRVLKKPELKATEDKMMNMIDTINSAIAKWEPHKNEDKDYHLAKRVFPPNQNGLCKVCNVKSCEFAKDK